MTIVSRFNGDFLNIEENDSWDITDKINNSHESFNGSCDFPMSMHQYDWEETIDMVKKHMNVFLNSPPPTLLNSY